jgi:hypothetical protein
MRRIVRNRCQKTASTWTRTGLFPSSFDAFLGLRDDEDDLPEPETPRAVVARMKIVNERLRQRWMSGRCCEYSAASDDDGDKRSVETAGAILSRSGVPRCARESWHSKAGGNPVGLGTTTRLCESVTRTRAEVTTRGVVRAAMIDSGRGARKGVAFVQEIENIKVDGFCTKRNQGRAGVHQSRRKMGVETAYPKPRTPSKASDGP